MSEYNYGTFSDINFIDYDAFESDINYDIKRKYNAKLEGNQAKTFFKTNPRPAKTPNFKNHSRTINLPHESILHPYRFQNSINLDAIPEFKIGYHHNEPILSKEKRKVSNKQLVQDYIHGRHNMYNDLEPVRCALRPEPIIPASSYLRGLLSEPKSTVSAGIVPIASGGPDPTGSGSGLGPPPSKPAPSRPGPAPAKGGPPPPPPPPPPPAKGGPPPPPPPPPPPTKASTSAQPKQNQKATIGEPISRPNGPSADELLSGRGRLKKAGQIPPPPPPAPAKKSSSQIDLGSLLSGKAGLRKANTRAPKTELDQFEKPALVPELIQKVAQKNNTQKISKAEKNS